MFGKDTISNVKATLKTTDLEVVVFFFFPKREDSLKTGKKGYDNEREKMIMVPKQAHSQKHGPPTNGKCSNLLIGNTT